MYLNVQVQLLLLHHLSCSLLTLFIYVYTCIVCTITILHLFMCGMTSVFHLWGYFLILDLSPINFCFTRKNLSYLYGPVPWILYNFQLVLQWKHKQCRSFDSHGTIGVVMLFLCSTAARNCDEINLKTL
jgi:hypothetical protein